MFSLFWLFAYSVLTVCIIWAIHRRPSIIISFHQIQTFRVQTIWNLLCWAFSHEGYCHLKQMVTHQFPTNPTAEGIENFVRRNYFLSFPCYLPLPLPAKNNPLIWNPFIKVVKDCRNDPWVASMSEEGNSIFCQTWPSLYPEAGIYVKTPATQILLGFEINPKMETDFDEIVNVIQTRPKDISSIPERIRTKLYMMLVLMDKEDYEQRLRYFEKEKVRWKTELRERGVTVARNLFQPWLCDLLSERIRSCPKVENKEGLFHKWNDWLANHMNKQLTPFAREITNSSLENSVSLSLIYTKNCFLRCHVDDIEFDFSISVHLWPECGSGKDSFSAITWANDPKFVRAELGLGDALMFYGNRVPHYRPPTVRPLLSTSYGWYFTENREFLHKHTTRKYYACCENKKAA